MDCGRHITVELSVRAPQLAIATYHSTDCTAAYVFLHVRDLPGATGPTVVHIGSVSSRGSRSGSGQGSPANQLQANSKLHRQSSTASGMCSYCTYL
jgi:hypothetical protein